jgi:hypothetical protein
MAISAEDNVTFNCDQVGIGETSPSAALHVKSNGGIARLESTSATGNNYLSFYDSSALKGHVGYTGSSDDDFNIFQNESANLKFFTAGSEAARFDSSQNFLVGNTSTNLSSSAFGTVLFSSGRTVHSRNVDGGASAMQIFGNAGECRIMGDGDILNTNNSYGAISDIRLKENIVDTDKKLSILNKVRVVDFNFIEKADTQTGVIAQELEELLPDLVNTGEDGYKTVKYSRFVPMLIKAVQEQQEQIESLTSEIANLKGG